MTGETGGSIVPISLEKDPDDTHDGIPAFNLALVTATFFDLDGTWFRWQWFHEFIALAVELGVFQRIVLEKPKESLRAYMEREGPFVQWVNEQVSAYQDHGRMSGVRVLDVKFVAEELLRRKGKRVHVFPRELSAASNETGRHRAIISGSMIEAVAEFAKANGISIFLGTEHPHADGRFTGGKQKEWCMEKGNAVRKLAKEHALDIVNSVAIGDSSTDIEMFSLVEWPICFNPNIGLLTVARANGWPVVTERKDVILIQRPDDRGKLREVDLSDILPEPLAAVLEQRLKDLIGRR